jgi:addiction module HigA family antidote
VADDASTPKPVPAIPLERVTHGVHPGYVLRRYLHSHHMTQDDARLKTGLSRTTITELLAMRRSVTASTAIALGTLFGTDADYWLTIQNHYASWRAQLKRERDSKKAADK